MDNPHEILDKLKPGKEFFIGIDSDGCVFDTMEIKQKECFCPMFIKHFQLQRISKYARETWEFVNLYSKTRGVNRFKAITNNRCRKGYVLYNGKEEFHLNDVCIRNILIHGDVNAIEMKKPL